MKQLVTTGIILSRTDFGEADRIITLLTPDQGKLRLMARGVRKVKSKLAGGIELFSVSDITFIQGRGEIGTLVSTRLIRHYGDIVKRIERVQLGYDLIKLLNKVTEDNPEEAYFTLMEQAFEALNDPAIDVMLIRAWYQSQLLRLAGHSPNLTSDTATNNLSPALTYSFDLDAMTLQPQPRGPMAAEHIKVLRLLFSGNPPKNLAKVQDLSEFLGVISPLINTMMSTHIGAT